MSRSRLRVRSYRSSRRPPDASTANPHPHPPAIDARRGPHIVRHDVYLPGLDPAHDGLRVAHLTDLHVGLLTSPNKIRRAIHRANAEHADLVVLTGDFVCYSPKYLGLLRELASEIRGPAWAVLGNHDYWTDGEAARKMLEQSGIHVLRNQHVTLNLRHSAFQIAGIDDAVTAQADPARTFRHLRRGPSRLVLTHVPSLADRAAAYGSALILAGHTHGGHVNIPRITAGIAARLGNRYLAGFFDIPRDRRADHLPDDEELVIAPDGAIKPMLSDEPDPLGHSVLYVNKGVGSASIPIRAGAPAEVAVLTLRTGAAKRDEIIGAARASR